MAGIARDHLVLGEEQAQRGEPCRLPREVHEPARPGVLGVRGGRAQQDIRAAVGGVEAGRARAGVGGGGARERSASVEGWGKRILFLAL